MDEIPEENAPLREDTDVSDDSDDDMPDDKFDPLNRQKHGGPKLKKQSMLQSMVEQTALEMGKAMPVMTRGAELEAATIKDVEDLKQTLAKQLIHIPNDVLKRAIVLPKDIDGSIGRYASPGDLLPKNPETDWSHKAQVKNRNKLLEDLHEWRKETFPEQKNVKKNRLFNE